ncbi:ADP/ATP translocase 4-like [Rhopalosiphum maidis]|uniref:ADP/ATP translocase 4-like n=1 Tax=Rhopalosiphum maidis TaxID=43146 RepID=UPI000EFEE084|nr:ADP/ATP translocase 4-like [Rhopalosiphum maidis]
MPISKKDKERSSLHEFGLDAVSSAVATAIARSVVAPFDRVKIISQVHYTSIVNGQNNLHYHPGILTTLNQIYREQGLRALWFGNFTNILRFVPSQTNNYYDIRQMYYVITIGANPRGAKSASTPN